LHLGSDLCIAGPNTMTSDDLRTVLLCVGGHDPSGGAGIQADAESARAAGVHVCSVISCLTSQDTCGIFRLWPQRAEQVEEQCRRILADSAVGALKIGLLGSSRVVRVLCDLAADHAGLPLVLDPVLASGRGQQLTDAALLNQIRNNLLERCILLTPNLLEARALSNFREPDDCAHRLLQTGCHWVLITGTHALSKEVVNRLYGRDGGHHEWSWPRLQGDYHGSGCTLTSAIAARIVRGMDIPDAVCEAQSYTWESLRRARRTGRCQLIPDRLFAIAPEEP
jgi:hydroxymethylpyrimidine/phosphomethylpyrimidine kinase